MQAWASARAPTVRAIRFTSRIRDDSEAPTEVGAYISFSVACAGARGAARLIWSARCQVCFRLPGEVWVVLLEKRRRGQRMGREKSTSCHPDMRGLLR
jgi:hypothetical protein